MAKDFVGIVEHIDVLYFQFAMAGLVKGFFDSLRGAHVSRTSRGREEENFSKHMIDQGQFVILIQSSGYRKEHFDSAIGTHASGVLAGEDARAPTPVSLLASSCG